MLNHIIHGAPSAHPPLIIAHGLFGSARNWGVIAKRLSDTRQVIAVDMRNHGDSFWHASHSYLDMADDLAKVIGIFGGRADIVGHSMGGKAAMVLGLQNPHCVNRLVIADIAPVAYTHTQLHYIHAMQAVDLSRVEKRADASAQLSQCVQDATLQSFFTQSLDLHVRRWKLNLDVLADQMQNILGFPDIASHFDGSVLMLTGGQSDYVLPNHRANIRALFPHARFAKLKAAGHWLHAEEPRAFEASVRTFLNI
jgi:esterase